MNYEKISDSIYLIDTLFAGIEKVVGSYLIVSDKATIIDTGYSATYKNVITAIKKAGVELSKIEYIMPTHIHLDHGGASGHLAKEIENSTVIVHERGAKHLVDPSKLIASVKSIFPEEKIKYMGLPIPIEKERVEGVPGNEEIYELGDIELRTIYTPGHAPHHMSIYINDTGYVFTGDVVAVRYPNFPVYIPTTPAPSFDPELAIKSVEKIESLEPKKLFTPHFGVVDNVQEHLDITKIKIREWVEKIEEITEEGDKGLYDVLNAMIEYVAKEARIPPDQVPENAKGSIYISVFGILHYLEKRGDKT